MLKLNYEYSSVKEDNLKKYYSKIKEIIANFKKGFCKGNEYTGWYDFPSKIDEKFLNDISDEARSIINKSQVFVVCGIGGSYLGARAVIEAVNGFMPKNIEIIYLGNTFDERYTSDLLNYLKDKEFCINVISKSGSTLETAIAFNLLRGLLIEKYGEKHRERVYITTNSQKSMLKEKGVQEGYKIYEIPQNIGGRFSVFTSVGLLPIAVANVDVKAFVSGAKKAYEELQNEDFEKNYAYQYAAYRYHQYNKGQNIELFASYSPYLNMLSEWLKQLFGESEGKEEKGLFPASVSFSADLHSLGQFIQQGSKNLFITQLKFLNKGSLKIKVDEDNREELNYLAERTLGEINLMAQEGTNKAHFELGGVDNLTIEMEKVDAYSMGYLMYFFMYSCMISAYLIEVNPFDQPGVEFYKQEMKKLLKNIEKL